MPTLEFDRVPFSEALDFFRNKVNIPTDKWNDLWEEEHNIAFTIAGITQAELLEDIRQALEKAIAQGKTRQEFLSEFDEIIAQRGWAYRGDKNWRANLIYQENTRGAHRAGRYAQMSDVDVLKDRQFVQWLHGDTRHPRPLHLHLDRKVFPASQLDALNRLLGGFGCQCELVSVSQRDIDREGLTVEDLPELGSLITITDDRKRQTAVRVEADPGWDYLPRQSSEERRETLLNNVLPRLSEGIAQQLQAKLKK